VKNVIRVKINTGRKLIKNEYNKNSKGEFKNNVGIKVRIRFKEMCAIVSLKR